MKAGKPKTITMPKSLAPIGVPKTVKAAKAPLAPLTAKPSTIPSLAAKKAVSLGKKFR